MWPSGAWLFAGTLRILSRRTAGRVQLQTSWFLPELRGASDGRKCSAPGRRGLARSANSPMGLEFSVSIAVSICRPTQSHGAGAEDRLPRNIHAPDQEGWLFQINGTPRRCDADPAFWIGPEPQYTFSYAFRGRHIPRSI